MNIYREKIKQAKTATNIYQIYKFVSTKKMKNDFIYNSKIFYL